VTGARGGPDESRAALRLRPLRHDDEAVVRAAHTTMATEGYPFCLFFAPDTPWDTYLRQLERHRRGVRLPGRLVPSTFLVAVVDSVVIGRVSIRHRLNEFLERDGGHIGYCVLPRHRRRGYATAILEQALVIVRAFGVDAVLLTCDDANIGSATVIERCGGVLDSVVVLDSGTRNRRYWIR
jgi:predicted acetyltransferase